jgi:hypothetical protein
LQGGGSSGGAFLTGSLSLTRFDAYAGGEARPAEPDGTERSETDPMSETPSDKPRKKKIYGLASIEMGDWVAGRSRRDGRFVENTSTGFKVFIQYPHPRYETGTRYIVEGPDRFRMGFALSESLAACHAPVDTGIPGKVFVGTIGGTYKRDGMYGDEGFAVLAEATHFRSLDEQQSYLNALSEAVPRIPAVGQHALRQDGGFGYAVTITNELQTALDAGEYIAAG